MDPTNSTDLALHVDIVHTVSINGIFTSIQYNSEIDQNSASFKVFLTTIQIFGTQQRESQREESQLWCKTIMTSKTNINQYKPSQVSS
jgi:hypothetical protein